MFAMRSSARSATCFALRLIESPSLAIKLEPPTEELELDDAMAPVPAWPTRSPGLEIVSAREVTVPKIRGWPELRLRRRLLHALANHELQAVELYARALVQFSDSAAVFRRDLLRIILEEQHHTQMYVTQLEKIGGRFGNQPVSGYFWRKTALLDTPLRFVCAMSLTFENANLDHTLESRQVALQAGDQESAELFATVHRDEIEHVRFGWRWLARLKPVEQSTWDTFTGSLLAPLHPGRASGREFHAGPRRAAGLDDDFIGRLREAWLKRKSGAPRGT